jgi:hypothetical protein
MPLRSIPPDRKQALLITRIMWGAMLMGEVVFLIVTLTTRQTDPASADSARISAYVAIGMMLMIGPAAFVVRKILYGPGIEEENVPPQKYATGNIVFTALLEGVAFFGLVVFMLGSPLGLAAAGPAMALQILNFPSGGVMGADKLRAGQTEAARSD